MTIQTIARAHAVQEDVVALWRAAVRGDARARQGLLQRIMPAGKPAATILPFNPAPAAPGREAA